MRFPLLLTLLLLCAFPAFAQDDCCCCDYRQQGQTAYNNGQYETAIARWQRAQKCSDQANCVDLNTLIAKARKKIAANRADDEAWELAREAIDATIVQRYLDKYPKGRHATDAKQRLVNLQTTPTLVRVEGGSYVMGDQFAEGSTDEQPVHSVTVSTFYLSQYEVSFDEYDAFCVATGRQKPSDAGWGRGRQPVINVDWYDALEYCNWLSIREKLTPVYTIDKAIQDPNNRNTVDTKKWKITADWTANGYRLPTEAEWEYAARQRGEKVRFGNGRNVIDPSEINFDASAAQKKPFSIVGEYRQKTAPVDNLSANSLGLKHMSGNVWEWCWDWYDGKYYAQSDGARNPVGPSLGQYHICRSGSWDTGPLDCRTAVRAGFNANLQDNYLGFRVARGH